jgi:hypothetical protein
MTKAISFEIVYLFYSIVGDGAKNELGSCCQQLYDLLNQSCFFLCKNGRNDALRRWKVRYRDVCMSTRLLKQISTFLTNESLRCPMVRLRLNLI